MYGLSATVFTGLVLIPVLYWAGPYTEALGTGINVFGFYLGNIFSLLGTLLLSGFAIGSISSYLAVKKYLKV
jgi:cell division protein FtsX